MNINRKDELVTLIKACISRSIDRYLDEKYYMEYTRDAQNIVFEIKNELRFQGIYDYIINIEVEYDQREYIVDVQVIYEFDSLNECCKSSYDISIIKEFKRKHRDKKLGQIIIERDGRIRFTGNLRCLIGLDPQNTCYTSENYDNKDESNHNFTHVYFEGSMVNGLPDGLGKLFWSDGKLLYEGEFKKGKVTGFGKTYFLNGSISSEGYRTDGLSDGEFTQYYESGQVEFKGTHRQQTPVGMAECYYEDGRVMYKGEFAEDGWAIDGLIFYSYIMDDIGVKLNNKGTYLVDTKGNIKRKLNKRQFEAFEAKYRRKHN